MKNLTMRYFSRFPLSSPRRRGVLTTLPLPSSRATPKSNCAEVLTKANWRRWSVGTQDKEENFLKFSPPYFYLIPYLRLIVSFAHICPGSPRRAFSAPRDDGHWGSFSLTKEKHDCITSTKNRPTLYRWFPWDPRKRSLGS